MTPECFCVAYTKGIAALWHDGIYLFVHESRAPLERLSRGPHMYALRTYGFFRPPRYFKHFDIFKVLMKALACLDGVLFHRFRYFGIRYKLCSRYNIDEDASDTISDFNRSFGNPKFCARVFESARLILEQYLGLYIYLK